RRIQEGSFGICEECDQEIHPKRLAAVPWAPFCIGCQEAVDGNRKEVQWPGSDLLSRAA
ncbi:MAG: transcriptional regulator, TraR/DksA family, partial [Bryobacterales bacterium]|nr:transcriptional regulator, TraR/DksA family [Bryobacterales bacterium]